MDGILCGVKMSDEQAGKVDSAWQLPDTDVGAEKDLKEQLARLEKRDWTLWTTAVVVLLLVCVAIITARAVPMIMHESDLVYTDQVDLAMRSLVGILLIAVGVGMDTVAQIESHLITRSYEGFMKGVKIKGRR